MLHGMSMSDDGTLFVTNAASNTVSIFRAGSDFYCETQFVGFNNPFGVAPINSENSVPEPTSLAGLIAGIGAVIVLKKRSRREKEKG